MRNGPGLNNLIIFKILKKGYPLLVNESFEDWRRVEDFTGKSGWISKTQLSDETNVVVIVDDNIFKFPSTNSKLLAEVRSKYVLKIVKCRHKWCKVREGNVSGWILKKFMGGESRLIIKIFKQRLFYRKR